MTGDLTVAALRVRDDYRTLTGPEKAAILMLALGEEHAAKLFALMDDEEINELSQTMANLGTVSSTVIERLFVEFADQISSTGSLVGTFDSTERLLVKVLANGQRQPDHGGDPRSRRPHHVGQARQRERGGARQLPEERIPADRRRRAVQDQAASTPPACWRRCPRSFAMEVVMRMLRMEAVQKDILDEVERTLRTEFMSNLARTTGATPRDDGRDLQQLRPQTESRFIAALEERNREPPSASRR